ncbi:uncharacterized protein BO88DRAFT_406377 [Aspergillus vadensis CBS 113365]|uniref:Uncharacterized protein n=1 Tax=Aspergillus vadensis (strain CBS 113365 / IMI 142717 / IBT 24658) TaxID=1448311 RepID=A0A319B470_ASPVC|nr:hypothetical protein BO88DRAFT_406377 [Aspergillus vadensis CBS 113365]PYH67165.1 hypothetical protein BO88DRAFT_406377 [Aspergillus vadensis CBS 113365]
MGYHGALFAFSFLFLMLATYIDIWGIFAYRPNAENEQVSTEFCGLTRNNGK